jgi:hypothetical protein
MKSVALLLAAALLVAATAAHAQTSANLATGRCDTDDEAPAAERAAYEGTALQAVRAILNDRPGDAHVKFAPEIKRTINAADFSRAMSQRAQIWNPIEDLKVAHSYRLSDVVGGERSMMICTAVARGNVSTPEGRVYVTASPGRLQAHVIVEGQGRNNKFAFVLWLAAAEQEWQILRLEVNPVTVLGRSSTELQSESRAQLQRGNDFNAFLLLAAAFQLTGRGPTLLLGIGPEIEKELTELKRPAELTGAPPYTWTYGGTAFRVLSVGATGTGADFSLMIQHEVAGDPANDELERLNQALAAGFKSARPEYAQAFDALVVRAITDGGRKTHGTVERTPPRRQ